VEFWDAVLRGWRPGHRAPASYNLGKGYNFLLHRRREGEDEEPILQADGGTTRPKPDRSQDSHGTPGVGGAIVVGRAPKLPTKLERLQPLRRYLSGLQQTTGRNKIALDWVRWQSVFEDAELPNSSGRLIVWVVLDKHDHLWRVTFRQLRAEINELVVRKLLHARFDRLVDARARAGRRRCWPGGSRVGRPTRSTTR
jgi:hypothetical protein